MATKLSERTLGARDAKPGIGAELGIGRPGQMVAGRDEGLVQYCTRHNGVEVGRANGSYEGVCATLDERSFLEGFNKGKTLDEARARVEQIESEVARIDEKRDEKDLSDEVRDELFEQRIRLEGKRVGGGKRTGTAIGG